MAYIKVHAPTVVYHLTTTANAEKILLEEAPIIPIMYNQSFSFVSGDLSGVKFDGFGNFVFTKASQKNYEKYLPKED